MGIELYVRIVSYTPLDEIRETVEKFEKLFERIHNADPGLEGHIHHRLNVLKRTPTCVTYYAPCHTLQHLFRTAIHVVRSFNKSGLYRYAHLTLMYSI